MNARTGETIKLTFDGIVNCIACGRETTPIFPSVFAGIENEA